MNNPESFKEDDTDKILKDFEIQMVHLISVIKPGHVVAKNKIKEKKTFRLEDFAFWLTTG